MIEPANNRSDKGYDSSSTPSFGEIIEDLRSMESGSGYTADKLGEFLNKLLHSKGLPSADIEIVATYNKIFSYIESALPSAVQNTVGFGSGFISGLLQAMGKEDAPEGSGIPVPSTAAIYERYNQAQFAYHDASAYKAVINRGTTTIGALNELANPSTPKSYLESSLSVIGYTFAHIASCDAADMSPSPNLTEALAAFGDIGTALLDASASYEAAIHGKSSDQQVDFNDTSNPIVKAIASMTYKQLQNDPTESSSASLANALFLWDITYPNPENVLSQLSLALMGPPLNQTQWKNLSTFLKLFSREGEFPAYQSITAFVSNLADNYSSATHAVRNWAQHALGAIAGEEAGNPDRTGQPGMVPHAPGGSYSWITNLNEDPPTPSDFFKSDASLPGSISDMDMLFGIIMSNYGLQGTPKGMDLLTQLSQDLKIGSSFPNPGDPLPSQDQLNSFLSEDSPFYNLMLEFGEAG